ncbi:hypothetical protein ACFYT3_31185 [Nocardia amikacinitolerans]|uniref:hypothetical protein n=1 Tax=Nocardia amikacinitolerans TaxID=756689 RepID=UPI00369B967B
MGDESGPKAQALATALAALRRAANKAVTKPTLARIVKHCADNGVEVHDSTVSGWLNGKSVPASPQEFGLVVGFLNGFAERGDSSYECLSLPHWERLRFAAREERREAQGQRGTRPGEGIESDPHAELHRSLYVAQVREFIAPVHGLRDRERELEVLTEFCHGDDRSYLWIQGAPWAGKSALLSSFVLDPPPNVTVVSFFVTDRLAAQNDHTAFTAAVLDQLAVLLPDHKARIESAVINRDGLRNELLALASRRAVEAKRRLVLVVDGLDEDTGRPPIVGLLPVLPDENLRVVVASRVGPRLPIPHGHPLAAARRYQLVASEFAAGIRDRAVAELDALLDGPERNRELLALITAANGLSVSELETLTGTAPFEIDRMLRGVAGRSFRTSTTSIAANEEPDPVYALAHETLQRTAEARLGARQLTTALGRLHVWAEQYRDEGWPTHTPDFLLHRYFAMLARHDDLPRMAVLAQDTARHEQMAARTGGDWAALTEIYAVQQRICDQSHPDLLTTARLARHRDNLHHRNSRIPTRLPALRAFLGQTERAEAIARSIPDPRRQAAALTGLAASIAATDPDRAEATARSIPDPEQRFEALTRVAEAIAATDSDRAERLTGSSVTAAWQAASLARVAAMIAVTDPGRAAKLMDRAEVIACGVADGEQQFNALARVAELIAATDSNRAAKLIDRAEVIARDVTDLEQQTNALARVAKMIAATDPDRAQLIASDIPNPDRQRLAIAGVAEVIATTDPDRAEVIARDMPVDITQAGVLSRVAQVIAATDPDRAEAIARNIQKPYLLPVAPLAGVAEVIAATDPDRAEFIVRNIDLSWEPAGDLVRVAEVIAAVDTDRAGRLADQAEASALKVAPQKQAAALISLAEVITATDPKQARQLADRAESVAAEMDQQDQPVILARVAAVIAAVDPDRAAELVDRAESIARDLLWPESRFGVLARLTEAVAAIDHAWATGLVDRAELIARDLSDPFEQANALARVAYGIAATHPGRATQFADCAEAIARKLRDPWLQSVVLAHVVYAVATICPDRAEAIADEIVDPYKQAVSLGWVAEVMAVTRPDRARRVVDRAEAIASGISHPQEQAEVLAYMAEAMTAIDPNRAETMARDLIDARMRATVLTRVAEAMTAIDPDHAETIARTIEDPSLQADALTRIAITIGTAVQERADTSTPCPRTDMTTPHRRVAKRTRIDRLLASAWATSRWEIPIPALAVADASILKELVSILSEK